MPIDLLNTPREISAIAEWLFVLLVVLKLPKRFKGYLFYVVIAMALPIQIIYMTSTGSIPLSWWIPAMVGAVLLMFLMIYLSAEVNITSAVYHTAKAFILAEFAAALNWQLFYFLVENTVFEGTRGYAFGFALFIYGVIFGLVYLMESRYKNTSFQHYIKRSDMVSIVLIVTIIFTVSNLSFLNINTPLSGKSPGEIFTIRTLVDFAGVILIYNHLEYQHTLHTKKELAALEKAFQSHYSNYMSSKETLDVVNQRLHDFKHQINLLKAEQDSSKRDSYLKDIENSLKTYGHQINTGHHVLDTIISSKNLICLNEYIQFIYVIDGHLLKFMNIIDLTSLFGNAIENAIESVRMITDEEKRVIKVAVYKQNDFIMIKFENYYENELMFNNGTLETTKEDKTFHGYGIKSIRSIAEKYQGNLTLKLDNHWFTLMVLLPIKN
ncbi:MAG: ATP-binding protein [Candidatus Izemoplasmataceae bacterium]